MSKHKLLNFPKLSAARDRGFRPAKQVVVQAKYPFLWTTTLLKPRRFPVARKQENGLNGYKIRQSSLSKQFRQNQTCIRFPKKYGFSYVSICQSRFAISSMQCGFVTQDANTP